MTYLLYLNLALRILVSFYAAWFGTWQSGDSLYFLEQTRNLFLGAWGGDGFRGVLYSWFLGLFSFRPFIGLSQKLEANINPLISNGHLPFDFVVPLLVQSLLVWQIGLWIFRKGHRKLALLFLFEPALFMYSHKIVADVLFAIVAFWFAIAMVAWLEDPKKKSPILCAFFLALMALTRSIGGPLIWLSLGFLLWQCYQKKISVRALAVFTVTLGLFVSPVLYWNYTHIHVLALATQGTGWLAAVVGAVKFSASGLDYAHAEKKWVASVPNPYNTTLLLKELYSNFGTWTFLNIKGWIRILFGHVNVEAYSLATGITVEGPGWFKNRGVLDAYFLKPKDWGFWVFGIFLSLGYCFKYYFELIKIFLKKKISFKKDARVLFLLFSGFFLFIMPMLFGDARFRPSVLVFWTVAALITHKDRQNQTRSR